MTLQFAECDRARIARDARYDGRFFTAVRTTKIYCRPVCSAQPRSENVCYFPSAAAADRPFRPVALRPKPPVQAPHGKAPRALWTGAALIIEEGALDAENARVESSLAARRRRAPVSGCSPASERDPFRCEDGARPACQGLSIDRTSMTEIAMRAGFAACADSMRSSSRSIGDSQPRSGVRPGLDRLLGPSCGHASPQRAGARRVCARFSGRCGDDMSRRHSGQAARSAG